MATNDNLPKPGDNDDIRSHFEDERTQARIHEHLNNEDDIITEQDIANIQVGAGASETDVENIVSRENELIQNVPITKEKDRDGDSDDPPIETPWNILGT